MSPSDEQRCAGTSPVSTRRRCFGPIVTTLGRSGVLPGRAYHQDFLTLNPTYPYIVFNDLPKVANLKQIFPGLYRDTPVLVSEVKS